MSTSSHPEQVLVIDCDLDNSLLLAHSIRRKFPTSIVAHTKEAVAALSKLVRGKYDVIVVHRTEQIEAVDVIKTIRQLDADVLVIAVSDKDLAEDALIVGANGFLHYDEWLRIGSVIANALAHRDKPTTT